MWNARYLGQSPAVHVAVDLVLPTRKSQPNLAEIERGICGVRSHNAPDRARIGLSSDRTP